MALSAMRYKDYVWPHNPCLYSVAFRRRVAAYKVPFGRTVMQDLGVCYRVMKGEGEFAGENAYAEFKKLSAVFEQGGSGILTHPVWESGAAYFVALELTERPRRDYVRYRFEFWECAQKSSAALKAVSDGAVGTETKADGSGAADAEVIHTVVAGDTLWGIARKYGVPLESLISKNPQIRNPNLIYPGNRVRVR